MTMPSDSSRSTNPWLVAAGETMMREGEPGTTMYVVVKGLVDVLVGGTHVATVGPGGVIGELAVITGQPRSATVVARATAWLTAIDEPNFAQLLRYRPYFAPQLLEQLSERLVETDRLLSAGGSSGAAPAPGER